jgi:carbon starvation protein
VLVLETLRVSWRAYTGHVRPPLSEVPHIPSRLVENWVRD